MKIVYFGSGAFGLPTLERLHAAGSIAAVVSQPDRPAGRHRVPTPTPVAAWAIAQSAASRLPLLRHEDVNAPAAAAEIRAIPADAWVVIAFGQKLSASLLRDRFAINLHASLLPRWRGAAPINHAILAGDVETGVSVITLADRMDAGLILGESRRAIDPMITAGELHDLLAADGPAIVERVLADHAAGRLQPRPQDESLATRAPKLSRQDAWIDFSRPAEECRRRIHALAPWPGVTVAIGDDRIKLLRAESGPRHGEELSAPRAPGRLMNASAGVIACGNDSTLGLVEVQPAGGRIMRWEEFVRGRRIPDGAMVEGQPPC